jgi:hypothetical protein
MIKWFNDECMSVKAAQATALHDASRHSQIIRKREASWSAPALWRSERCTEKIKLTIAIKRGS